MTRGGRAGRGASPRPGRRHVAPLAAAALAGLVAVPVAGAIAPPSVQTSPASPSQSRTFTFTFAAQPDPGNAIIGYEGGIGRDAGAQPAAPIASPARFDNLAEGTHHFRVRAVQQAQDPAGAGAVTRSGYATARVVVNRTPPTITATLDPARPDGANGWYRSLTVRYACSDAASGIASCPSADVIGDRGALDQGDDQRRSGTAVDRVGLRATATTPRFDFDSVAPRGGEPRSPGQDAKLAAEPTFVWSPGGPDTSGVARYEVYVRYPAGGGRTVDRLVAGVAHTGALEYRAARSPSAPAYPERVTLSWYVRTIDVAGNVSAPSGVRRFTIDATRPPAPTIVAGPEGPTNVAAPPFAWRGSGAGTYAWDVTAAGADAPLQSGTGAGTSVTLRPLAEGDYTFRVSQITSFGAESAEATRTFAIDLTPPPPPVIVARPPAPSGPSPAFAWTTDPGTFSRWRVIGGDGRTLHASDTPGTSVALGPLASGSYLVRVAAVDPAGNASEPASEPFTVAGAAVAAARPPAAGRLPRRNARLLRPRAGAVLPTRRPVLRWARGPADAAFYNVQIFRVVRRRPGASPVVRKVHTAFPRARQLRAPMPKMLPSTCYGWRVWPHAGGRFTRRPLGVSNFCIASRKVLARAAAARARRTGTGRAG